MLKEIWRGASRAFKEEGEHKKRSKSAKRGARTRAKNQREKEQEKQQILDAWKVASNTGKLFGREARDFLKSKGIRPPTKRL